MGRAESKSLDCSSQAWAVGRYGMRRGIEGFFWRVNRRERDLMLAKGDAKYGGLKQQVHGIAIKGVAEFTQLLCGPDGPLVYPLR